MFQGYLAADVRFGKITRRRFIMWFYHLVEKIMHLGALDLPNFACPLKREGLAAARAYEGRHQKVENSITVHVTDFDENRLVGRF